LNNVFLEKNILLYYYLLQRVVENYLDDCKAALVKVKLTA